MLRRDDINPANFYVGLIAAQGSAAAGRQAGASPRHTRRSTYLRQRGAGDNQIDQDDLFDCQVNRWRRTARARRREGERSVTTGQQCLESLQGQGTENQVSPELQCLAWTSQQGPE